MGIGSYAAGMASCWMGWSPWLSIPFGAFTAGAIGMLFGYPFSRLRALYYAMGSLFFGVVVINIVNSLGTWTGGYAGLSGVQPLFATPNKVPYYYFVLGLTLACIVVLYRIEFSRLGITLKAISQSHLVASSVGINESYYRTMIVGVGCFFAGLAGAVFAHYNQSVSPSNFDLSMTMWLFMYVLIGGMSSFAGPLIGAPVLYLIPEFFRGLKAYSPYITAAILIIIVYLMPKGLVELPHLVKSIFDRYIKRNKSEKG
jgi:branched-chain amino acid transport system permease protein